MSFYINDPETEVMVRQLANLLGVSRTEAIKRAAISALERDERERATIAEDIQKLD